ncbi:macrolide 2'-phosphotransferase [Paenibacillus illinoisensis]|uniref:macrolide 2'-phosphotransferase n=1 Tax=Paenibacillus illinoisensis TaxID=59845 RepID=UPI00301B65A2
MTGPISNEQVKLQQDIWLLAEQNGLQIRKDSMEINESGMDFRVAFAADESGQKWVLRQPRRGDVWGRAENERKVLGVVKEHLSVKVPDWRICTPELIAYPLLDGEPIAVVDPAGGGYAWRFPQEDLSDVFFDSLAAALVQLHGIDASEAVQGGVRQKTPREVRQEFASNMEQIKQSFMVPERLAERWEKWVSTDHFWPEHVTFNHGDLHPPHIIVNHTQRVTGLIDWTEAEIADPGKDFVILYGLFQDAGLRDLLKRYEKAGGKTWPRMFDHIREQWAAYPVLVAQFALITGEESTMEMARGMLASWDVPQD